MAVAGVLVHKKPGLKAGFFVGANQESDWSMVG